MVCKESLAYRIITYRILGCSHDSMPDIVSNFPEGTTDLIPPPSTSTGGVDVSRGRFRDKVAAAFAYFASIVALADNSDAADPLKPGSRPDPRTVAKAPVAPAPSPATKAGIAPSKVGTGATVPAKEPNLSSRSRTSPDAERYFAAHKQDPKTNLLIPPSEYPKSSHAGWTSRGVVLGNGGIAKVFRPAELNKKDDGKTALRFPSKSWFLVITNNHIALAEEGNPHNIRSSLDLGPDLDTAVERANRIVQSINNDPKLATK